MTNTNITAETITTAQIKALRSEAEAANDSRQVDICDLALAAHETADSQGDDLTGPDGEVWTRTEAREMCADAINAARAMAKAGTYRVTTDSASETIDAANADEAARIFAESEGFTGVTDLDSLRAYLVRAGGYGTVADADGAIVMRVGA